MTWENSYIQRTLSQCHTAHNKYHMYRPGTEPQTPQQEPLTNYLSHSEPWHGPSSTVLRVCLYQVCTTILLVHTLTIAINQYLNQLHENIGSNIYKTVVQCTDNKFRGLVHYSFSAFYIPLWTQPFFNIIQAVKECKTTQHYILDYLVAVNTYTFSHEAVLIHI